MNQINPLDRLFSIKKTQIELVKDRGFDVGEEEIMLTWNTTNFIKYLQIQMQETNKKPRYILSNIYQASNPEDTRLFLAFYGTKQEGMVQLGREVINEFYKIATDNDVTDAIIIIDVELSTSAKETIKNIKNINLQIFKDEDLTYNPSKHIRSPKYELLDPAVAKNKLLEMKTDVTGLPLFVISDPIVKYYGWKVGDVIKIYRDDSYLVNYLSPKSINYRLIISEF
jgi:DNA-directed RNA polymerase I, II, and III subunit RPABC1